MKLTILFGSARKNGNGVRVAQWIQDATAADKRFELDFVDAGELELPFFNEEFSPKYRHYSNKEYTNPAGKAWAERVAGSDAFIFITPEYNHSYSAVLKNALDWVGLEWNGKPVGLISYSITPYGGVRALEHLRQIVPELGLVQVPQAISVSTVTDAISEQGVATSDELNASLSGMLDHVHELASKLQSK